MRGPEPIASADAHLGYLDGWRGLAIALVLEAHFVGWLPIESGRFGVDIFFCLSGWLMSGLLFVQRQPLARFYKRRISRILPAYLAFVAIVYAVALLLGRAFTAGGVVSTLLFLRTYLPTEPGILAAAVPIGHLWSLNVEEHCYIGMSLLILLGVLRGREGVALMLAGAICIGIGIVYAHLGDREPHWGMLGTEVAASHLLISAGYRLVRERHAIVVPAFAPLLALALATATYAIGVPWWAQHVFSPLLLAFAVNHLSQAAPAVRAWLSVRPLRQLGLWSYSIYLWQQPFYKVRASLPGGEAAALALALAAALTSFYVLERPCRTWLNRHW